MGYAVKPLNDQNAPWTEVGPAGVTVAGLTFREAFLAGLTDVELAGFGLVAKVLADVAPPALPSGLTPIASVRDVNGVPTRAWSATHITRAELVAGYVAAVNAERDRRIDAGLTYNGGVYQTRPSDRENLVAMGLQAQLAVLGGAQPGDLRWHGGASDFAWILADNSQVTLDAPAMAAVFGAAVAYKNALTFFARATKTWLQAGGRTRAELLAFDPAVGWP